MRLVYFASVREAMGRDGEDFDPPAHVNSIDDCLTFLAQQGAEYAAAFAQREKLRFALDQQMAKHDAPIGTATELAIFPPVTGG
ncbi:MoaD/ThiS family protein [Sphingorhabdus arenilitoris]|uniref:MoaD/ThiS family protein n=1 Tax=Sphingorhabdus arenilitoris TaxID=1490041 RepID=A0ABV8RHM2_9SPHN